jgi:hypothetical protein
VGIAAGLELCGNFCPSTHFRLRMLVPSTLVNHDSSVNTISVINLQSLALQVNRMVLSPAQIQLLFCNVW